MTLQEGINSILAKLGDSTPATSDKVKNTIPLGVAMFCAEYQWEFLDKFATMASTLDSATGFYRIVKPADFFKPVVLWTAKNPEVEYIDRYEFATRQVGASGAATPQAYTVIGEDMFLDRASSGDTIFVIYTRKANNVGFEDVPGQYHNACILGTCMHLMPAVLKRPGGDVANPAYDQASELYADAVNRGLGMEAEAKGRPMRKQPSPLMKARSQYS